MRIKHLQIKVIETGFTSDGEFHSAVDRLNNTLAIIPADRIKSVRPTYEGTGITSSWILEYYIFVENDSEETEEGIEVDDPLDGVEW
jgi:hypothetical protein